MCEAHAHEVYLNLAIPNIHNALRNRVRGEVFPTTPLRNPEARCRAVDSPVDLAYDSCSPSEPLCSATIFRVSENAIRWNIVEPGHPQALADNFKAFVIASVHSWK